MQLEGNWSDVTDIGYRQYHIGDLVSTYRMVGPNKPDLVCESLVCLYVCMKFIGVACSKQHTKYQAKIWAILAIQQNKVDQNELFEIRVVRKIFVLQFGQNLFLKINRQKQNE